MLIRLVQRVLTAVGAVVERKSVDCHRIDIPYALIPRVTVVIVVVETKLNDSVVREVMSVHASVDSKAYTDCV